MIDSESCCEVSIHMKSHLQPHVRSGVEWIPFICVVFSLSIFLFVFARMAHSKGLYLLLTIEILFCIALVLLSAFLMLKELCLYADHCAIEHSFGRPDVTIPYSDIEKAKYYPHVFRSGPTIRLFFRDNATGRSRRIRFGLAQRPDLFVAALMDRGVRVVTV